MKFADLILLADKQPSAWLWDTDHRSTISAKDAAENVIAMIRSGFEPEQVQVEADRYYRHEVQPKIDTFGKLTISIEYGWCDPCCKKNHNHCLCDGQCSCPCPKVLKFPLQ